MAVVGLHLIKSREEKWFSNTIGVDLIWLAAAIARNQATLWQTHASHATWLNWWKFQHA